MAYYDFAEKIINNKQISVYNYGKQRRDFTYIDDITSAITKIITKPPTKRINYYRVLNIGKGKSDKLIDFIKYLEVYLGKKSKKKTNRSSIRRCEVHQSISEKITKTCWF